jgi:hypothetical protein
MEGNEMVQQWYLCWDGMAKPSDYYVMVVIRTVIISLNRSIKGTGMEMANVLEKCLVCSL